MRRLGTVQQKIPCVFVTEVKEEHSMKRDGQVCACANANTCRANVLTLIGFNNDVVLRHLWRHILCYCFRSQLIYNTPGCFNIKKLNAQRQRKPNWL